MATFFRNKVINNVGTVPIPAFDVTPGSNVTVVGISVTNITEWTIRISIVLKDDTSVEGFFVKDVEVPPNNSFRALPPGEKLIMSANNVISIYSDMDDSADVIFSYVEIV